MDYQTFQKQTSFDGRIRKALLMLFVVVIVPGAVIWFLAYVVGGLSNEPAAKPQAQTQSVDQNNKEETVRLIAMVWVKAKLKDPDSAQFRNLQYTPPFVCGEVNAKNSFGGYNGFERFITGTRDATFLESEVPPGDMDKAWQKYCKV